MINLLLAMGLFFTPVVNEESVDSTQIEEVSESTEISESESVSETAEGEEEVDEEYYITLINQLKEQITKYESYINNETIRTIASALIDFLVVLGALYIRAKKFDIGSINLSNSKTLLEDCKKDFEDSEKEIAGLMEELKKTNINQDNMASIFTNALNTLNKSMLRINDRLDELEKHKSEDENKEE